MRTQGCKGKATGGHDLLSRSSDGAGPAADGSRAGRGSHWISVCRAAPDRGHGNHPRLPAHGRPVDDGGTKSALADTGVGVLDIEFVKITPEIDVTGLERFVATGAELGAKYVITAPYDPDLARLADRLGAISDLSVRYGLRAVLEFFPWTVVPDLGTAVQVMEAAGRAETGILVDTLHFNRSGSKVEQLHNIPGSRLPFVHVCDATVQDTYTTEELLHTGRAERLPPGEGGSI